jgi:hypothetical protein
LDADRLRHHHRRAGIRRRERPAPDHQGDYTSADRSFTPTANLRARVYFYDNGAATLGTNFQLLGSGAPVNCGTPSDPYWVPPNTGLGVKTDLSGEYYMLRINCPTVVDSNGIFIAEELKPDQSLAPVPRRIGWHLFELLVTPFGTYARIDDRELARLNPAQLDAASGPACLPPGAGLGRRSMTA